MWNPGSSWVYQGKQFWHLILIGFFFWLSTQPNLFSINLSQIVTANATRNFEYFSPVCFDNISPKTWSTNTSPVSKKTVPQFCMLLNWARVDKQLDELAKSWVPRISEKVCPCHYCWYFFCQAKKNWCWVWGGTPHGNLPDLGSIHFDKTTDNVSSFNLILKKIVLVIIVGTFCQVNELTFLYTTLLGFVYPLHRFMR